MTFFSGGETHARSVLKAVSWRVIGTIDTFVISWLLTGKLTLAGSIAGLELFTKLGWVDSTGGRNTLRKLSDRCDEAKSFPRSCVEFQRNGVEIGLTVN